MNINNLQTISKKLVFLQNKQSILQTKPNCFRGKNITLTYTKNGKSFALPRFISEEMREARIMNKAAINEIKQRAGFMKPYKAEKEDLVRLEDQSFPKVLWMNPKNGQRYYLLKTGKTADGKNIVRILNEDGSFIKEAVLKKKNIIQFEWYDKYKISDFNNLTHAEIMELFIKRYNPFIEVKQCYLKNQKDNNIKNLLNQIDENTAAISCAFQFSHNISPTSKLKKLYYKLLNKRVKVNTENLYSDLLNFRETKDLNFEAIPPHIRIFVASGNNGKNAYNSILALKNIEGVGSLDLKGKLAHYSASRNSYFTQHYERGEFPAFQVPDGFMLTDTNVIDIPLKSDKFKELKTLHGTSISVSIRAAKAVLNQMMDGIL